MISSRSDIMKHATIECVGNITLTLIFLPVNHFRSIEKYSRVNVARAFIIISLHPAATRVCSIAPRSQASFSRVKAA